MRKTILAILGSTLIAASMVQVAAAAERHQGRHADRVTASGSQQFRNSNAYYPVQQAQPDYSRYSSGGLSAPAGR